MIKLLCTLFLSVAAWGVTASPTSITVYMNQYDAYGGAGSVNMPPLDTPITVSGTGAWGLARGGTLATACGMANGYCFTASSSTSGLGYSCPNNLPAGSGATTLYLCWKALVSQDLTPGTYTGTLTVGSTTINITLIVKARPAFHAWTWPSGSYPSGCTTDSGYDTPNRCTFTNERPTSTSFSIPAVGGSYVDPQFGSTVSRVTSAGVFVSYSAVTAFNADDSLVFGTDTSGNVNVYPRTGGAATYSAVPVNGEAYVAWDPTDPNKMVFYQGAAIKSRNLSGATTTTLADYSASSGTRPALTTLYMGGTADITDDNWWTFYDAASQTICAVNLNGLTTGTQESKTYCANYSGTGITSIDFPQVTQVDSESGKRYVVAMASPSSVVWSVNTTTGTLSLEYIIPTGQVGFPAGPPHSDVGQDRFGRQFILAFGSSAWQGTWVSKYYLNRGTDIIHPVSIGGGWDAISQTAYGSDGHFGCNWKGLCVLETSYFTSITAQAVSSITAANPCQINTTSHGYANGASIQIGGATGTGASAINGVWTITTVNANAYTIPVSCIGASYTANSASSAPSSAQTAQSFRNEIQVVRRGGEMRRLALPRFIGYAGNNITFYRTNYSFASISRSGRYVAYHSNYGVPEQSSIYVLDIGYTGDTEMLVSVDPADTKAVLNYVVPAAGQGAATVTISANPNLTSPVVSASDGLTAQGRQYVATGLTAGTQYYYRISTTGFTRSGQFTTAPTLSGTARVTISKGGGGTVNYGTTSALGSSCTSPCDLSVSKGLLYTDVSGSAAAQVVR